MAKKLTEVYEKNTSSDESKPEVKQTFVSGHWRTYGGEKKVKPEKTLEKQEVIDFLAERVAKWWVPDEVLFVESLPVGGTGKVQKNDLRVKYGSIFNE